MMCIVLIISCWFPCQPCDQGLWEGEVILVGKLFICTVGVVYWPDLQIYVEQYVSWSQCGMKMDWCYRIVLTRLPHLKNECCVWSGLRQSADLPINMEGFLARHCCTGPCRIQITQFRGVGNINRILSQERFLYDLVSWSIQPLSLSLAEFLIIKRK